jgi:hypothetical protein
VKVGFVNYVSTFACGTQLRDNLVITLPDSGRSRRAVTDRS